MTALLTSIIEADKAASLWINTHGFCDGLWIFFSQIKVWIPLYLVMIGLLIWKFGWKKGLIAVACVALAFFFNERLNNLLKAIVERVRPCNDESMIAAGLRILETGGGWSFPSGHANNSFGFAFASLLCYGANKYKEWLPARDADSKKSFWHKATDFISSDRFSRIYAILIVIWASMMAISRVFVGRHFLGDILVGAVLGALMGWLWGWIFEKIMRRWFASK